MNRVSEGPAGGLEAGGVPPCWPPAVPDPASRTVAARTPGALVRLEIAQPVGESGAPPGRSAAPGPTGAGMARPVGRHNGDIPCDAADMTSRQSVGRGCPAKAPCDASGRSAGRRSGVARFGQVATGRMTWPRKHGTLPLALARPTVRRAIAVEAVSSSLQLHPDDAAPHVRD
ncbi:hypothetical protein GCM10018781_77440 [Kitasatospora indigofera]|uniref:Uncharacterized protein n=1 Tax=Kitasatospora indigofera TaxID=67307 RepID=A0A918YW48_9ACTN|nr:hypothetical protein GCM10018781_77440 [Kitasatospora indigofera]